jgi:hypothetical protein
LVIMSLQSRTGTLYFRLPSGQRALESRGATVTLVTHGHFSTDEKACQARLGWGP